MVFDCYALNTKNIYFECPFHSTFTLHIHGSEFDLRSRMVERSSHCSFKGFRKYYIEINEKTPRAYLGTKDQILKRGRKELEDILCQQCSNPNRSGLREIAPTENKYT